MENATLVLPSQAATYAPNGDTNNSTAVAHRRPSPFTVFWVRLLARLHLSRLALRAYKSPARALQVLRKLHALKKNMAGGDGRRKFSAKNGRYWFGVYMPPFPSANFDKFMLTLMDRLEPHGLPVNAHEIVNFAVTTRCSMRCEHCYEWDNLNKPETFSIAQLKQIAAILTQEGAGHIALAGGEPMMRFDDVLELVKSGSRSAEWWIFTSGYRLSAERARLLKEAGLAGVVISLDHYDAESHNVFRGHRQAFQYATEAAAHAGNAGLVVAFSVCFTRVTANRQFAEQYMALARNMGADFVQWLEPVPQGHYRNKDVVLTAAQIEQLEQLFLAYNHDNEWAAYPPVVYHGYHQRREGCLSGGRLNVYIDAAGMVHSCPFCHSADFPVIEWLAQPLAKRKPVTACQVFAPQDTVMPA
jgi:MoaA/NifB/PqqE/SkfB family radical SAM enzyme